MGETTLRGQRRGWQDICDRTTGSDGSRFQGTATANVMMRQPNRKKREGEEIVESIRSDAEERIWLQGRNRELSNEIKKLKKEYAALRQNVAPDAPLRSVPT